MVIREVSVGLYIDSLCIEPQLFENFGQNDSGGAVAAVIDDSGIQALEAFDKVRRGTEGLV